jgi:hypothetical protein
MRKYLILGVALGLIFALNAWAATTTISGKVTAINPDSINPNIGSFSLIKNLNWLQRLTSAIFIRPTESPITFQVTENTKFYLRTSQTAGFIEGSFSDLQINDQVNVLTDVKTAYGTIPSNNYIVYTALEVKITGRFIPVTKPISTISPPTTLVSPGNTITIDRALTLELMQDLSDKKMIQVIDSNLHNLYRIIITPQTKLKIGSITEGGDWLNIGLPKLNAEPKTWYDLRWSDFPKLDCTNYAIIKIKGTIRNKTCYTYIDADTVYFYSLNIDPGCPIGQ